VDSLWRNRIGFGGRKVFRGRWASPSVRANGEAGGAFITSQEWLAHPGSVGRPVGRTVHILDDGNELPPRQLGRICFG